MTILSAARTAVSAIILLASLSAIAVSIFAQLDSSYVVRGGSMEPAIPKGSIISLRSAEPSALRVGDVVTVRGENGIVLTHRLMTIIESDGVRYVQLKGDANAAPDPFLVPVSMIVGRVSFYVPYAGYFVGMLSVPSGFVSVMSLFGSAFLGLRLLRSVDKTRRTRLTADAVAT